MRIALIADVHSNLYALLKVLDDIQSAGVGELFCLGDLVGYGAQPDACVDMLRTCADGAVAGNHDRDVLRGDAMVGTHQAARRAQRWTAEQLGVTSRAYLAELPPKILDERGFVAIHGSFLNDTHVSGYITSTMLGANLRAVRDREGWPRVALAGHTHQPMVGWLDGDEVAEPDCRARVHWPRSAEAVILNPGSVGQPRDGDRRAAWGLLDLEDRSFEVRRVEYDHRAAAASIRAAGLPEELALRLLEGV